MFHARDERAVTIRSVRARASDPARRGVGVPNIEDVSSSYRLEISTSSRVYKDLRSKGVERCALGGPKARKKEIRRSFERRETEG